MEVYLVRHGEAKSEEEDASRPLTEKGRGEIRKVAVQLAKAGIKLNVVVHSDKLRAKQTAEIFANYLKPMNGVQEMLGLAPNDKTKIAEKFLEIATGSVMLVGHLPHLSKLTALLVTGKQESDIVAFGTGGVVCLTKQENWKIKWSITPEVI